MKKNLFITLSNADPCGIADYSNILFSKLKNSGLSIDKFHLKKNSSYKDLIITSSKYRQIIIQYPAWLYRKSFKIVLALFVIRLLGVRIVLVLHEHSKTHYLRKLINIFLCFFSFKVIVTNFEEYSSLQYFFKKKSSIIPIASNINSIHDCNNKEFNNNIVFFGLVRSNKGLKEFIEFCKANKEDKIFNPIFIGKVVQRDLWKEVKPQLIKYSVDIYLDLNAQQVSEKLHKCSFGYLHFPDGVSERRGSYLAFLNHGVISACNKNVNNPNLFKGLFIPNSYNELVCEYKRLKSNRFEYDKMVSNVIHESKKYSWEKISKSFISIIN